LGTELPLDVSVKIRYRSIEHPATLSALEDGENVAPNAVRVSFTEPLRDITPGQAAVFYAGEQCLGGGIISG
jgi:tRNA-specific 2-thiouridylase